MINRLRTLERRLVLERTHIGVGQVVDRLLLRWDHTLSEDALPPDPLEFPVTLVESGIYLLTTHRAVQYLERCSHRKTLPDRDRLLSILLPGGGSRDS